MYKVMLTASSSDGKPSISATKSEPDIRVDVTLEVPTSMLVRPDPNGHVLPHYSLNVSARNHTIALLGPGDHFWHSLSVSSTAGSIHIPAVRVLRNFSLSTTGGDITSSGDVVAHSTAALDTTNGAITLAGSLSAGSDLTLSTTNGRVLIAGPVRMYNGGALKATTTNASIDLDRILLFPRQDICARITTTNAKVWFGVAPHSAEAIDSGTLVVDAATTNAAVTARVAVGVPFQWSATNTTLTPQPLIRVFGAPYWANVGSVGGPGRPSNKLKMASTNAAPIVVEGLEEPL
ncbi:hypothetical protein BC828DRAFT_391103 [Blastocladiella britannica]|nr:hypothetical protein BC828DRAFT_391103 [Blastocladiella britannica]